MHRWHLRALLLAAAIVPLLAAEDRRFALRPEAWEDLSSGTIDAAWQAPESVTLSIDEGTLGSAIFMSQAPLTGDFEAEVRCELLEWPSYLGPFASAMMAISTPAETPRDQANVVQVGRELSAGLDQFRAVAFRGRWQHHAGALAVPRDFRLRLTRGGEQVQAAVDEGGGFATLQAFALAESTPLRLVLSVRNTGNGPLAAVTVRFSELRVRPVTRRRGGAASEPPAGGAGAEWVIYSTAPGWLRIGPRAEFDAPTKLADEIWGGTSQEPLPKELIAGGFPSREATLEALCARLTKVRYDLNATRTPKQVVRAMLGDDDYYLRLDRGLDPDSVLAIGQTYDLDAEKKVLAEHGLTPRWDLGYRYLIHATGHGTVDGPVRDDVWILYGAEPQPDKKDPKLWHFRIADGWGGTFGYTCDAWEGPYRDNFGAARALRRLNVERAELWPAEPGRVNTLVAAEVPDDARDHGAEVPGVQAVTDPPELRDWVVYVTAEKWLHIGTRQEFATPVPARETIWQGNGEQPVAKSAVDFPVPFVCYQQALEAVCRELSNPRVVFHPNNEPRETIEATFRGREVICQMARGPRDLVAGYRGYDTGGEFQLLLRQGLKPLKRFGRQWLVHATGHGTYSGPVKDDHWMMVGSEPRNGGVTVPDGTGGTFGYSVDQVDGPFEESLALAAALRRRGLEGVGVGGTWLGVRADEFDTPPRPAPKPTRIVTITPDRGEPGTSFYVTVIAEGMKPWYGFRFGEGVRVSQEVSLGRNPDGEGERWLATITVDPGARFDAGNGGG